MSNQTANVEELIALSKQLRIAMQRDRARLLKLVNRLTDTTGKENRRFIQTVTSKGINDVRTELSLGADPNAISTDGEPAILIAASRGKRGHKIVATLLAAGANVDATDAQQNTALIANSRDSDLPLVRLLVDAGADVNRANDQGDTPLTNAATWGALQTVSALLHAGAHPNHPDGAGILPAELAAQHGHKEIESLLRRSSHSAESLP